MLWTLNLLDGNQAATKMDSNTAITKSDESREASDEAFPSGSRAKRNWLWIALHIILYPIFRTWIRTTALHVDRLDRQRGGILLINHQSYLDPILVAVNIARPVAYLARQSLFKVPGLGFILRNCFVVAISRTAFRGSSVRAALKRLEDGFLVALFPEGTRHSGSPRAFRPGFLTIARRSNAPIYPVAVVNADAALPRGAWFPRPKAVTVVYGNALTKEERRQLEQVDDQTATALVEAKVLNLYHEGKQRLQNLANARS